MKNYNPYTPPLAPEPEPEAVLRFGDVEIRLGLTFVHHLINCQGWGDRECTVAAYRKADHVMDEAMRAVEKAMWAEIDKKRGP